MLTTILLLVGALLSLLKGFDWEEASLMTLTAALLGVFRRSFYRASRLTELPFSPLYLVASLRARALRSGCCCSPIRTSRTAINCGGSSPSTPTPRAACARCWAAALLLVIVPDLAAAHRAPGDSPADPDELDRATKS
jgi:phosphatidylglycerol lysyltransferase